MSPLRERFAYYHPDNVWYKRLSFAFFRLPEAGNATRMARRDDAVACRFYLTGLLRFIMQTCFLLRRRYAPYHKWLFKAFRKLPEIPSDLVGRIPVTLTPQNVFGWGIDALFSATRDAEYETA